MLNHKKQLVEDCVQIVPQGVDADAQHMYVDSDTFPFHHHGYEGSIS